MSVPQQIPALFLMVLCHVVVIYHMLERKYGKKKFVLISCLYAASFVCMGTYMYMMSGTIKMLLVYLGIAVCLFLFFLHCLEGVLTQEKFFVPYLFWPVFHHRQLSEAHGNAVFTAPVCSAGILSGKCTAHGIVIIDAGII